MDDKHGRERPVAGGLHQIAAHGAGGAAGRGIADVARFDARVGEGDRLRPGIARQQRLRHGEAAGGRGRRFRQEHSAVHPAVAILVVKIEHALVDLDLGARRGFVGLRPLARKVLSTQLA